MNVQSALSQCNTRLRLLHLLYHIDFTRVKQNVPSFSMFYDHIGKKKPMN